VDDQAIAVRFPGPGIFCSQKQPDRFRVPVGFLSGFFFPAEYIGSVVNLTIRSHSVKRIRITGILSLLPSYAFLECTATTWPFNSNEQDRQCTYTVTLRRVREWKSNNYYIFSLSFTLRYPACNANAPFCHLLPAPLYSIFSHYLINGTIFEKKKLLNIKCVFLFSTTFVWNISHSKKNWARYDKKCISVFM
jgi:hypothetical protein